MRVFGPYGGKLNNAGDDGEVMKPTLLYGTNLAYAAVDRVDYTDELPWPAEADGWGLSLQRRDALAFGK